MITNNIKIEEKDVTHHKLTITEDEVRVKIKSTALDEKDKVLEIVNYILSNIEYPGFVLRCTIVLQCNHVLLKSRDKIFKRLDIKLDDNN